MSQPMPPSALEWNNIFNLAGYIAISAVALVMIVMVYYIVKNRERRGKPNFVPDKDLFISHPRHSIIFASISIGLLLIVSIASFTLAPNARFQPTEFEGLVVKVTAFQWSFRFEYPNGVTTLGQVSLPENTTVEFNVTSTDVMHNFYLVEYRVSIDAIAGRYNAIWITTPPLGTNSEITYHILCKELCGVGHTYMKAQMTVLSQADFNQWLSNQTQTASGE